jgi:hypothetical protein
MSKVVNTPEGLEELLHFTAAKHDEMLALMVKAARSQLTQEDRNLLLQSAVVYQMCSASILAAAFNLAVPYVSPETRQ